MDGGLQCQICPYKAPRIARLKKHMEVAHQGLRLACGFCKYTSTESSNLKRHIQRVHEGLKHNCEHCDRVFGEKHKLKKHTAFVHLNNPRPIFSCKECKKEFYTREAQRRHTSTHLGISYPCEKCDYKANLLENLNRHTKARHEEKTLYFCQSCDYKGSKKGLRVHIESKHGSKLFKCDQCEYISSRDEYLKMHVRDQHGSDIFYCNLCDYSWHSKSTLRDHVRSVHSNTSYQCTKCDHVTKRKDSLSHHMQATHETIRHKCDSCEKVYKTRRELGIHILNKHEGVVWQCTICPYKAASRSILAEHRKHVHGINLIKKHKCLECGQMFGKRRNLTKHFRIHSGEMPYQCEFCYKKLRTRLPESHKLGQCKKVPTIEESKMECEELKIKCEHCNYLSENQSILKLHTISHQISLVDIMKNLPPSIKDASFKTEDEFQADLKTFFDNSSVDNIELESLTSNHLNSSQLKNVGRNCPQRKASEST